jgi:hypothetical protein
MIGSESTKAENDNQQRLPETCKLREVNGGR